jgi:hypothetical protein
MSKLNLNKPLAVTGREAKVIHTFSTGALAVVVEGESSVRQFSKDGYPTDGFCNYLVNAPVTKVYTLDIYPTTGQIYKREQQRAKPCQSSYPDMFSVVIREQDGVIVSREIV